VDPDPRRDIFSRNIYQGGNRIYNSVFYGERKRGGISDVTPENCTIAD